MKRKLLTLSCTIVLCLSLTSCGLKTAITGDKTASTDDSKATETNSENKDDTNTGETAKENTNTASAEETTDDAISTNNNSFVENTNSNVTSNKSELSSTINTVNRNCRVFYFNKVDLKTYCVDTNVKVTDNALVTALTEKLYSAPNNNNNFVVLSKDYGVRSATLNYDTNVLTVVFNENFIKDMELSAEVANGVIGAVVNTYGYNYGVDKVAVYFGDELYTSTAGTSSDEYSTVNYSDVLKLE
ncbi:GerMN domain-containing protein [uncultured Clostridium sp.]|uniref:GerMN domain-containing protein n=1 Tax=uncultured Clostridium sp. TaxID=59620 RepID=UPI0025E26B58|nr:GerMN domain-containing protein [uncultured Clostridium sp.]MDU4884749.1 GerMN domain-containing protein [Clostridium celatum]MDU7077969.1 GerMN domain-containing protein [Clostridium celatum]